ncbi:MULTISPECIES: transglycosylase domain-containing protein [unclassified Nesterenkonia]|uniref:transglycosylase domain-containing protein n=1 Tax=unclassified Nesterenkonia TaxID=2629769 RepID=UPI002106BE5C|nr:MULTISPECIES: transglycosylase domain-containing protein [unclassified Nesterenkonia]
MASRKSPLFDTATTVGKIMSFLGVSALCGLLAAGLIFPLAASGGAAAAAGTDILEDIPAELAEEPLSVPSHIYASDGTELATFYAENRQPVALEDISQEMIDAIIAIEDERFYEHGGVDPRGLSRALVHNATSDSQQGASTITQQYVNNMLINAVVITGEGRLTISGTGEKTYADKLREMKLAVAVEQEMTKDEILAGYLNIVLLGGRTYGVEAAAQYYWGIPASELNVAQAAVLAGMVQSPNGYNPEVNPEASQARRDIVLGSMLDEEVITQEEYDEAVGSGLGLEINREEVGCVSATMAPYFCDYVRREILASDTFGPDEAAREELLDRGGLRITTTLDPDAQTAAQDQVEAAVPVTDESEAAATLTSVEPGTGNILSMAQNRVFDPDTTQQGRTTLNYNVGADAGGGGGFQAGSSLKPFVVAAWIEEGGETDDVVDASVDEWADTERWEASCLERGYTTADNVWDVSNVEDNSNRRMTIDYGVYFSVNTATLATSTEMDLCAITDVTDRLGVRTARDGQGLDPSNPSFVLGPDGVSPLTQAAAYAAFADDGNYCEPRAILEVTDTHGNEYDVPEANCEQVIDEDVVAQVNDTTINIAEGTVAAGDPPFPMAGKTGTNDFASSTWFVGYSSGVSTASWIGNTERVLDGYNKNRVPVNGQRYDEFFGSTLAAPMWLEYMTAVGDDYDTSDFREADDSPYEDRRDLARYRDGGTVSEGGDPGGEGSEADPDEASDDERSNNNRGGNNNGGGNGGGNNNGGGNSGGSNNDSDGDDD